MFFGGGVSWFEEIFGFEEDAYEATRAQFTVETHRAADGDAAYVLTSKANQKSFYVGPFHCPSVAALRSKAQAAQFSPEMRPLTFGNVTGCVRRLHWDPGHAGAVFQVRRLGQGNLGFNVWGGGGGQ